MLALVTVSRLSSFCDPESSLWSHALAAWLTPACSCVAWCSDGGTLDPGGVLWPLGPLSHWQGSLALAC